MVNIIQKLDLYRYRTHSKVYFRDSKTSLRNHKNYREYP